MRKLSFSCGNHASREASPGRAHGAQHLCLSRCDCQLRCCDRENEGFSHAIDLSRAHSHCQHPCPAQSPRLRARNVLQGVALQVP